MELAREFILVPADLDRLSIKCKSCSAEFVVSLAGLLLAATADRDVKQRDIPASCPCCNDDWSKMYGAARNFRGALEALKEYGLNFRIPAPEPRIK